MKFKQKVESSIALIIIFLGTILLLLPLFKVNNIKWINIVIFGVYAICYLIQHILTYKSKDNEGLYTFIASIIALIISLVLKAETSPGKLSLTLMIWITLMSITKLKKADYYHDRRDRMWKLNLFILFLFILTGLLASINLYYEPNIQVIVIGFFFLINGILELIEPIVKTLIAHS